MGLDLKLSSGAVSSAAGVDEGEGIVGFTLSPDAILMIPRSLIGRPPVQRSSPYY